MITNQDLIIFFVFGLAGAAIYEATRLIGGNLTRVKVENKAVPLKTSIPIFVIVGGVITLAYEMHFNIPFDEANSWKILVIGFGWQAIVKNYVPSEKAAPRGEPTMNQALNDRITALEEERDQRTKEHLKQLDQSKKS